MNENKITLDNSKRTECQVWSRVMGYYRPMSQYNKGKAQEAKDRKCFSLSKEKKCHFEKLDK